MLDSGETMLLTLIAVWSGMGWAKYVPLWGELTPSGRAYQFAVLIFGWVVPGYFVIKGSADGNPNWDILAFALSAFVYPFLMGLVRWFPSTIRARLLKASQH